MLLAAPGELAAVDVPTGEVAERAAAVIVVLDALGTPRGWGGGRVRALPGLDLGLLDYPWPSGKGFGRRAAGGAGGRNVPVGERIGRFGALSGPCGADLVVVELQEVVGRCR